MNGLTHAALPFAHRPAGGKPCAFSVNEAGALSPPLSGEARSDLFIDLSDERPETGTHSACSRAVGLSHVPGTDSHRAPRFCSFSRSC